MRRLLTRLFGRSHPMSCEEADQFLTAYMDEALDPKTRARFEAHLQKCPLCLMLLEQMQQTATATQAAHAEVTVPRELADHTLLFLDEHLSST
ncbi:MAG: zf-HC2 domain-containing protein [Bacteroidota bacterium]